MSNSVIKYDHLLISFIFFGLGVISSQPSSCSAPNLSAVCLAVPFIVALGVLGPIAVNCPFQPTISPLNFGMGVGNGRELDMWITSRIRSGGGAYGPNVWIYSYKLALVFFFASDPSLLKGERERPTFLTAFFPSSNHPTRLTHSPLLIETISLPTKPFIRTIFLSSSLSDGKNDFETREKTAVPRISVTSRADGEFAKRGMETSARRVGDWVEMAVAAGGWDVIMRMDLRLLKCNILLFPWPVSI